MKKYTKHVLTGMLMGAFLLTASAGYVNAAQCEEVQQVECAAHNPHFPPMSKEKAAEFFAKTFGVSQDEVLQAMKEKKDFRSMGKAAMFSKISGKSFQDVMAMKTKDNHWSDVQKELGITKEQIGAEHRQMEASRLAKAGNITKDKAFSLLSDGYQSIDIRMAGILSKSSGKDIDTVLGMKKINNRWRDVAKELGIDGKELKQQLKAMHRFHGKMPGCEKMQDKQF